MQDPPAKELLLDAVSVFLEREIRAAVTDPRLAFRLLVAANLTRIAAAEIRTEDDQDAREIGRLRGLLADAGPPATPEGPATGVSDAAIPFRREDRHAEVARLEVELVARVRARTLDEAAMRRALEHVRATLREKLAVANPKFDLAGEIE